MFERILREITKIDTYLDKLEFYKKGGMSPKEADKKAMEYAEWKLK